MDRSFDRGLFGSSSSGSARADLRRFWIWCKFRALGPGFDLGMVSGAAQQISRFVSKLAPKISRVTHGEF